MSPRVPLAFAVSAAVASLAGCESGDSLGLSGSLLLEGVAAVGSSVYVVHPFAEKVVRVDAPPAAGEDPGVAAFETGSLPVSAVATPAGDRVWVLHGDEDFLLDLPWPDGDAGEIGLGGRFNRITFSPDGDTAVLYLALDGTVDLTVDGSLAFDQVGILDVGTSEVRNVTVGFDPHAVAFTPASDKVVVLASDQATVIDVSSLDTTGIPFTLDAGNEVTPSQVLVTDDGEHALVTVEELPDLFDIRLVEPSVNIVSLSRVPEQMARTSDGRYTVLVSGSGTVDVIDNLDPTEETTRSFTLPDGVAGSVLCGQDDLGPYAFLYATSWGSHIAYVLRPDTGDIESVALENPVASAEVSASGRYVAVVHSQEGYGGEGSGGSVFDQAHALSVVDIARAEASPRAVEGPIRDILWSRADAPVEELAVAVDLAGWDVPEGGEPEDRVPVGMELVVYAVPEMTWRSVALPLPPTSIGALPTGGTYVVHAQGLGAVSFVPDGDGPVSTASGLLAAGLFLDDPEADADAAAEEE